MFHNLVKLLALISTLESIHTADGQQTLQAGVDGVRIVGAQQLEGDIEETGPLLWEVMLKDLLKEGNELCADVGGRGGQRGDQPLAEARLFGICNRGAQGVIFEGSPTAVDAVFQVDTGCGEGLDVRSGT